MIKSLIHKGPVLPNEYELPSGIFIKQNNIRCNNKNAF